MNRDLAEIISKAIDYKAATIRVAIPGKVVAYYASKQTADVQPVVDSAIDLEDGTLVETMPVLYGIPVEFVRGGGFQITLPIQAGDTGVIEFCDFSIDLWRSSGNSGPPNDLRTHSLGNAIFRPGLSPATNPIVEADAAKMVVGKDSGPQARFSAALVELGTSGGALDFVALAQKVNAELTKVAGEFTKIAATFASFIPGSGGASFAVPYSDGYSSPGSVAGSKVKAE